MADRKRIRRSKQDIESIILEAASDLIIESGFNNVTISSIVQKAKIEPAVFYKRYSDVNDLFDKLVREFDYWLNDAFNFDPLNNKPQTNCENLLIGLIDSINSNPTMQKLLIWELSEDNYITRRTSDNRERHSQPLVDYFVNNYSDPELDIKVVSAIIISGIYYLALHKNRSTFCGIDFESKEGISLLKKNVHFLVNRIYSTKYNDINNRNIEIACRLLADNVDARIVKNATGVSDAMIDRLLNSGKNSINGKLSKKKG
jgi:AcrR family transcriptional regulator